MSVKTKIFKARIKNSLTRSRFIKSYEKKKAILMVFLVIVNMFIWNGVIDELKNWEINISERGAVESYGAVVSDKGLVAHAYETKKFEEDEVVIKYDLPQILDKIRRLESSGGKSDSCLEKGLINGYGYAQNDAVWLCYETHDEVRGIVADWLVKHLTDENMSLQEALCHYNQGDTANGECEYVDKYNKL